MDKILKQHTEYFENKAENGKPLAAEGSAAPETSQGREKHDYGKHKPLLAERIFDTSVYGVWNYGIQVGTSVLAAEWFKHRGGKKYFEKAAQWMGENVMSKITNKTGAAAAKESHTLLIFAALITVGNLFIPPIQHIEKHKDKWVSAINDKINAWRRARGNAPDADELREQQESIQAIALEPQQTSASLWGGRALGLSANILAAHVVGEDRNMAMETAASDLVKEGLQSVGLNKLAKSERVRNLSQIAFLDYGYSIISANVIYLYSHFINPPKYANGHERHNVQPQPAELPVAQERIVTKAAAATALPDPQLLSGSKFVQLKPTNPELAHSHDQQLAI